MPTRSRGRLLLFAVPLSAVLVVLLGVVSGGARPFRSARVYGGPTQGLTELSLRVEVGERDKVAEVPVPGAEFRVVALQGGQRLASTAARSDALGMAEVVLRLPRAYDSALELWVEPAAQMERPLARGLVLGSLQAFRAAAGQRGGFQRGRQQGDIALSVAPARGVLVTAQGALQDQLVIRAEHNASPVGGARVRVELEGAEPAQADVVTDRQGLARLQIRPREPRVRVELAATAEPLGTGKLAARLDVVQGAIRAQRRDDRLLLETSGAASLAFVGIFDQRRRWTGLHVALAPAPDGRLVGETAWPAALPAAPLWVVTSSQPDLASPAAVGWPVGLEGEPAPRTFDARELLLLDGAGQARAREERRSRRVRWVTSGYAAVAFLFTLWLFWQRVREADANIERHLSRAGMAQAVPGVAPPRRGRLLLALACIGLGFVVLALLALFKQ